MQLDRTTFVLYRPCVKTAQKLDEGGFSVDAEKIEVRYTLYPWSLTLDIDVTVDKPTLEISAQTDIPRIVDKLREQNSLFNIRPNIQINQGVIFVRQGQDDSLKKQAVYLGSTLNFRERNGHIALSFDDPQQERNSLDIRIRRDDKIAFEMEVKVNQLDMAAMTRTMNQLHPTLRQWSIEQGFADGHILISRTHGKRLKAEGSASLLNCVLNHPGRHFCAQLKSLTLDFTGKEHDDKRTLGTLSVGEGSSLAFMQGGHAVWEMKNIAGGMRIEKHGNAKIKLAGDCVHKEINFGFHMHGGLQLFDDVQTFLHLALETTHSDKDSSILEIGVKQINDIWNSAEFSFHRFGYREIQFIQEAATRASNKWSEYFLHDGSMDGQGIAYFKGSLLHSIKVNQLEMRDLAFDCYPYEVSAKLEKITGKGSLNFCDVDFSQSLNTDFSIEKGSLQFAGINQVPWKLSDIYTDISFRDGTIQSSIVHGDFAGMKGTIEVDWLSSSDIMKVHFLGGLTGLCPLLPKRIQKGLQEKFLDNQIAFNASLQNLEKGFHAEGIIEVQGVEENSQEAIAFGFDIERILPRGRQKRGASDFEVGLSRQLNEEAIHTLLPALASPMWILDSHWQSREQGISGFIVRNGWLYAEEMPLEKYVAPFIFQTDEEDGKELPIVLKGVGNFHGAFDHTGLSVSYIARDVVLDSKDFKIEIESIVQPLEDILTAEHHIEFLSGMHFGKIPVVHGNYLDKNTGLLFSEINTVVKLEGQRIHATDIECFCSGLFFAGDINVDRNSPHENSFDVEIIAHTMSGKVSQVQSFFSHFDKPPLVTDFPIEGDVMFRGEGGYLFFAVRPEGTQVNSRVAAVLSDGLISFPPFDLSLRELGMHLDFDQQKNTFILNNIQGTMLVGKPGYVDEYLFSGDQIAFSDFTHSCGQFDLWVGDKKRDIVRLVGTMSGDKEGDKASQRVKFTLDKKLSHFGDVYPDNFALTLKEWKDIEELELEIKLQLSTLYADLKRASRSGLFTLPDELFAETNQLGKAKGEFSASLRYDISTDNFAFCIAGKEIALGPWTYDEFLLKGTAKDRIWSIDQLRLDDLSIAAELNRLNDCWKINFLGLKIGNSLIAGLEGEYVDSAQLLHAKIHLLEISLAHLNEWPYFAEFVSANSPSGKLKGIGELRVERHAHKLLYDGFFSMNSHNLQMKGVSFADAQDFSVQLISDKGFNIRNFVTKILPSHNSHPPIDLQIEKIAVGPHKDAQVYEGLHLKIPHQSLQWFAGEVHRIYPEAISDETQQIMANLKKNGTIHAAINMSLQENDDYSLELTMNDGQYAFADADHEIKEFQLKANPLQLSLKTLYRFRNKFFWINYIQSDRERKRGEIILTDEKPKDNEAVEIRWERHPLYGFLIHKAQGTFGGIQLQLERDWQYSPDSNYCYLVGMAKLSIPKMLPFCTKNLMKNCIEQKIGADVLFEGKIAISKKTELPHKCIGGIEAHHFAYKGYQFNQLNAHLDYKTHSIRMTDVAVQDQAGSLTVPEIALTAMKDETWWMHIPKAQIKKMRPSLLQEVGKPPQTGPVKALVFNGIEVASLRGKLEDSASWLGTGTLKFSNPPRMNLQHTILALPHEIIMRLGLNPTVLTPVTGTIFFDISGQKVNFRKFKDVYSESKGSKFYLAGGPSPSCVDFDGNLNVNIRMKQYNLLFKLAELFIVSIKGNIHKPVYSLNQERSRSPKKIP